MSGRSLSGASTNVSLLDGSRIPALVPVGNATSLQLLVPPGIRMGCTSQRENTERTQSNQNQRAIDCHGPNEKKTSIIQQNSPRAFLDRMQVTNTVPAPITARRG
jgi:hypothetical protein